MKVIKDNFSNITTQITCKKCDSILEIDRNDVKHDSDHDLYVTCPLCLRSIYLSEDSKKTLKI